MDEKKDRFRTYRSKVGCGFFTLLLLILAWIVAAPNFVNTNRNKYRPRNQCINNLRIMDGAKQQWAVENHKSANDIPRIEDVAPFCKNGVFPKCPQGGTYTIGRVDEDPTCSILDHKLPTP
jgi:hypothetical protein